MKQARIVKDFKNKWLMATCEREGSSFDEANEDYDNDGKLTVLSGRIDGEVVNLTESHGDLFEDKDNNFVIYPELICEI